MKPKNINKLKRDFAAALIGILLLIAIGSVMLGFYRPFVPWVKVECSFEDGTLVKSDGDNEYLYRYEVDGVLYEKVYKWVNRSTNSGNHENKSWKRIYFNANNPEDTKRGVFGLTSILIVSILFIVVGVFLIWFVIIDYIRKTRGNLNRKK